MTLLPRYLCILFTLLGISHAASLPEVDLGYSTYRASSVNVGYHCWNAMLFLALQLISLTVLSLTILFLSQKTGNYYTFSNIRFAAPPVGDLRFRAPAPPLVNRSIIIDGSLGYTCPQSQPGWWTTTFKVLGNLTKAIPAQTNPQEQNEDCLFLDVVAPASKFEKSRPKLHTSLSPVLVWIHGGGYFIGDKTTLYDPAGFFKQSNDDIVYMAMNYRVRTPTSRTQKWIANSATPA